MTTAIYDITLIDVVAAVLLTVWILLNPTEETS